MTPFETKFQQAEDAAMKRIQGFKNSGTIPCEYTQCECPARCQIDVTTVHYVVGPDLTIELVCLEGARHFNKLIKAKL